MANLITFKNNEPTVSSLDISQGTSIQHKSILALIDNNFNDFKLFGEVAFEMRLNKQGTSTRTYYLDERQATLLFTYMRNKPLVKRFKIAMVYAFYELKQKHADQNLLQSEILLARPLWREIIEFKKLGLNHAQIGKLLERKPNTIRQIVRRMEACGLIEPPKNLAQMQQHVLNFLPSGSEVSHGH